MPRYKSLKDGVNELTEHNLTTQRAASIISTQFQGGGIAGFLKRLFEN